MQSQKFLKAKTRQKSKIKIDMKKYFLVVCLLLGSLCVAAWNSPITIPDVGNARLRIVGQNMENYLTNFDASNSSCSNQSEFDSKTNKMANVFLALNADIVAVCEAERNDEILGYLCTAMNSLSGTNVWTFITDGNYSYAEEGGYQAIKSGYIYRSDKVTPVGNSTSPYPSYSYEYNARMRIQLFKENATNELFTLSINHFKAKSGSDGGESTRLQNVSNLLSALNAITADLDILIMGDLNSYMGEQPILNLEAAGYAEQLTRFDANAYTYVYQGSYGILDHCMANSTMASQITGAYAYNINHEASYSYKYSDHDAVLVGLNLGEQVVIDTIPEEQCPTFEYDFCQGWNDWTPYDVSGDATWSTDTKYGAKISAYNKQDDQEHWLISPALDMSSVTSATLTVNHQIYYDNGITEDYWSDQTVWVSTDYTDGTTPSSATWTQMPLSDYAYRSYVDGTATIPTSALANDNVHIAFKYISPLAVNANYWEIKTASIETECEQIADAIENTEVEAPKARKVMYDGRLYIEFNGQWFDTMGRIIK